MKLQGPYLICGPAGQHSLADYLAKCEIFFQEGIKIFQFRPKELLSMREKLIFAKDLRVLTRKYGVTFFINDSLDLALLSESDGLHIGPKDYPVSDLRKYWSGLLGLSNHSQKEFLENRDKDVDYLSLGPIFPTTSKVVPDKVQGLTFLENAQTCSKPIVAIGGITLEKLPEVLKYPVDMVGVISDLWDAKDPKEQVKKWRDYFA